RVTTHSERGGSRGGIAICGEVRAQRFAQRLPSVALGGERRQVALLQRNGQEVVLKERCQQRPVGIAKAGIPAPPDDRQHGLSLSVGEAPAAEALGGLTESE